MTLQQLEYFDIMAQTLHYTKSANLLHISQPSLSYALSQLEKELNCPLFKKEGNQIYLTKFGESFKFTVQSTLSDLNLGIEQLKQLKNNLEKEIKLGYIQSLSRNFIPTIIEQYYASKCTSSTPFRFFPNQQCDLINDLKCGLLDVVIGGREDHSLACEKIFDQKLTLIVPRYHPFASLSSISIKDLSNEPIIMLKKSTSIYATICKMFKDNQLKLNIFQEAYDYTAAINYVSLGKGISLLPSVENFFQHNVVQVEIRDFNCVRPIYILWDKNKKKNSSQMDFIEFIKQSFIKTI